MNRLTWIALLTVPALGLVTVAGPVSPAVAAVAAVSLPGAVPVDGTSVSFTGTVRVGASVTGLRAASLWFRYPGAAAPTLVGSATSRTTGVLSVTGHLDARRITPGRNVVEVLDDLDGAGRTITLDLRRRSRIGITRLTFRSDDRAVIGVRVRHYDPRQAGFVPSRYSPVRLQEQREGRWVDVGTATTGADGRAEAIVPAGPGAHRYRALRPEGATVLSAVSLSVLSVQSESALSGG